jgi:LysR family transcriptional regulator, benzoate and cis,cis-muconate-responsive activator of ben and cat genes
MGRGMRRLNVRMDGQIAVLAVAEKGSYAAAGDYLGVGKSAIRKQVEHIDHELGARVFRFSGKRMVSTAAGDVYLPEARESVRHARLGVDRVQALLRIRAKELRIGYSSHLSERLLAIITEIQPQGVERTSLKRESLLTRQVVSKVLHGELDVGFGFLPIREHDLSVKQLMEEPLMLCLPAGHKLIDKHTIEPEELEGAPIIAVARTALPGRHNEIVGYFQSLGISLKFVADAFLPREALWQVSRGVGFSLMTRSSASTVHTDVVLRPFSDQSLTVKSGVFNRRDHDEGLIEQFIEMAWAETASLRPKTPRTKKGSRSP